MIDLLTTIVWIVLGACTGWMVTQSHWLSKERKRMWTRDELIIKIRENAMGCKAPCAREIVQWTHELEKG